MIKSEYSFITKVIVWFQLVKLVKMLANKKPVIQSCLHQKKKRKEKEKLISDLIFFFFENLLVT